MFHLVNYSLWMMMLAVDSIITGYAFEPKRKDMSRWKCIVGMMISEFPPMMFKLMAGQNEVWRLAGLGMMVGVVLCYMHFFMEGYFWEKALFRLMIVACMFVAEIVAQLILYQDMRTHPDELVFGTPLMTVLNTCIFVMACFFCVICLIIKRGWNGRPTYRTGAFYAFCLFPISQILLMIELNTRLYKGRTFETHFAAGAVLFIVFADVFFIYVLLRQQEMYELEERLCKLEEEYAIEQNHYREIESRNEELAKIRHDLNEHLIIMKELLRRGEYEQMRKMLSTLKESVQETPVSFLLLFGLFLAKWL